MSKKGGKGCCNPRDWTDSLLEAPPLEAPPPPPPPAAEQPSVAVPPGEDRVQGGRTIKEIAEATMKWVRENPPLPSPPPLLRVYRPDALKSTVLLSADSGPELHTFSASIGAPMSGAGNTDVICTAADTNVIVANTLVDERMLVRSVRFEIPRVAAARFQLTLPCGKRRDQPVYQDVLREIVTRTMLSFYVGSANLLLRSPLSEARVMEGAVGDVFVSRGRFLLGGSREIGRLEKFWVELSWPNGLPDYPRICPDADVRVRVPLSVYLEV